MAKSEKNPLAALPRVDRVVAHFSLDGLRRRLGKDALTRFARRALEDARRKVREEGATVPSLEEVAAAVEALGRASLSARARRVINATGVILHTNLGRAPLARSAVEALSESAGGYTSIEIDLTSGRRGARGAFAEGGLSQLSGAEAALVVNNNAAAVLLALSALCAGKKVVVSRGELIEIGGGFRVPDVCARSGAVMVEVGTTNKTRVSDYAQALSEGGVGAILRVHQGNFRQTGFVERPRLSELTALAHEHGVLLVEDLGGGAMLDLSEYGLSGEPTVGSSVKAGCDVVCFSTDKVLGGPQGGALVGKAEVIEKVRRDPLARALRLGRLPLVALEATVALYLEGRLDEVPALAAVRRPIGEVRERVNGWQSALAARGVSADVVEVEAAMGGGALAEAPLGSVALALGGDVESVAARLRTGSLAVVGRIQEGRLLLDGRTVLPGEDEGLIEAVVRAVSER